MFTTDAQTVADLEIFGKGAERSLYTLYNHTRTRGGAQVLEEMFRYPLSDAGKVNKRAGIIQYFAEYKISFSFKQELFDAAEQYLSERDTRTRVTAEQRSFAQKITSLIATDSVLVNTLRGITALIDLLNELRNFLNNKVIINCAAYSIERQSILGQLSDPAFTSLFNEYPKHNLSQEQLADYDGILRFRNYNEVRKLLQHIYYLDVYISVGHIGMELGFTFPRALDNGMTAMSVEGFYHPQLKNAVANDIEITPAGNVIFLTGANMAGKSTLMKSLVINIYLAHMGFPVAAKKLDFSVMDGIYTTINLPDNLGIGVSHFYAEVLRLKKIATELSQARRLFVVFDELFRGTNVKDACEGTIAVTEGFAGRHNSVFVISTHITEAGEVLKERCANIRFKYLPTRMNGTMPEYTYTLETGITDDRHGMIIINNEGILELLKKRKEATVL